MANTTPAPLIKAVYLDGTTQAVTVSIFDKLQAEKYAAANGWGNIQESPMAQTSYALYFALRKAGKITQGTDFDKWTQTLADIDASGEPEAPLEAGTAKA